METSGKLRGSRGKTLKSKNSALPVPHAGDARPTRRVRRDGSPRQTHGIAFTDVSRPVYETRGTLTLPHATRLYPCFWATKKMASCQLSTPLRSSSRARRAGRSSGDSAGGGDACAGRAVDEAHGIPGMCGGMGHRPAGGGCEGNLGGELWSGSCGRVVSIVAAARGTWAGSCGRSTARGTCAGSSPNSGTTPRPARTNRC